jgi:hypothetical protein
MALRKEKLHEQVAPYPGYACIGCHIGSDKLSAVHTSAGCCAVHCRANIRSSFIANTAGYGGIKAIPII